jgi:muramoyltetrapeptide carboxypeptidase LdcA involved in peptidoglycan recycling
MNRTWWSLPLVRPKRLSAGDRVAVISPSWGGPAAFPQRYDAGKKVLEERFGLIVVEMPNTRRDAQWLDANPQARADDFMQAFGDPSIKAVIASIGGDDSIRLAPYIDLSVIQDNPKIFLGYSDPTTLHFACLKAGVVSFHGPTLMSGFAENGGISPLTESTFRKAAFSPRAIGALEANREGWTAEHIDWSVASNQEKRRQRNPSMGPKLLQGSGTVRGRLIGGCAEVLEMLKGSDWWPQPSYWDNCILFYETSEEAPSSAHVLRWLRNFHAQGILSRLSGFILARAGGHMDDAQRAAQHTAVVRAFHEAGLPHLPILADLDFGHTDPIATIPYGIDAEIDCDQRTLTFLESAVSL